MRLIGTPESEFIQSPRGPSTVRALAGDDTVKAAPDYIGDPYDSSDSSHLDPDLVYLGPGDDLARDFMGHDTVYGGSGDDTILMGADDSWGNFFSTGEAYGDAGDDFLSYGRYMDGGAGDDTLKGDGSRMIGGAGNDVYLCENMASEIVDRQGASVVDVWVSVDHYRQPRDLRVVTGDGRDVITISEMHHLVVRSGGRGDEIEVYGYKNRIYSGDGNDSVTSSSNGDEIWTGNGRDSVEGGSVVHAGQGDDTVQWASKVYGGGGDDRIDDCRWVDGGTGDDTITDSRNARGGEGNDSLENCYSPRGQAGDDFVGGKGLVRGDNGNDTLEGRFNNAQSDDVLEGGRGNDTLLFAYKEGDDVLRGGEGADTFALRSYLPDLPYYLVLSADIIADFEQGIDVIDLSADADLAVPGGFTGREGVAAFEDLTITQAGDDVTIRDQEGYVLVVLADQLAGDFAADDFIF